MKQKKFTITVGIPTYYGAFGLIKTAESIVKAKTANRLDIIVTVDGNPLEPRVQRGLARLGVTMWDNKDRAGQLGRIKQLIKRVDSDILILTQDDVIFASDAINVIEEEFQNNPKLTMIGCNILPLTSTTFFEKVVNVGVDLTHRIGKFWNKGDNYLLSSGRCLAFRSNFVKKFEINEGVINSDAYLYFLNKLNKGKFKFLEKSIVYNKSPQNISEHLKQSRKFQISNAENSKYLERDMTKYYLVPKHITVKSLLEEFIQNPVFVPLFFLLSIYTRFVGKEMYQAATRFWETDITTKQI